MKSVTFMCDKCVNSVEKGSDLVFYQLTRFSTPTELSLQTTPKMIVETGHFCRDCAETCERLVKEMMNYYD